LEFIPTETILKTPAWNNWCTWCIRNELLVKVGAEVTIRKHNAPRGVMTPEDLEKLTPAMIHRAKKIAEKFRTYLPVKEVEYILNDNLYKKYNDARSQLRKSMTRGSNELLLFHGTAGMNIPLYNPLL
jgi:hypothetical protein